MDESLAHGYARPSQRTYVCRLLVTQLRCFVVGIVVAIAACSSADTPAATAPSGPYGQEISDARVSATSDFEKRALADGVVSRAEYEEAVRRQVACTNDRG